MSDQSYRTEGSSGERRKFDRVGRGEPDSVIASVIDTARENPFGAALVGMGLAWFLGGSRSQFGIESPAIAGRAMSAAMSAGGSAAADWGRSTGDAIASASGYVSNAGAGVAEQAGDLAGSIGSTLSATGSQAANVAHSARSQLGQMLNEQPLLLAAGAFAIGAAMAASLPLSQTEERVIGDAAESALQSQAAGSIGSRLRSAATAAKDEARRQGLTPDALKTQAGQLRDRVTGAIGGVTGPNSPPA